MWKKQCVVLRLSNKRPTSSKKMRLLLVHAYKRHAYKKICLSNSFVALPRLHATAVDCAHELINRKSGIKGEASKILQN